jgi:hypothetical protein
MDSAKQKKPLSGAMLADKDEKREHLFHLFYFGKNFSFFSVGG